MKQHLVHLEDDLQLRTIIKAALTSLYPDADLVQVTSGGDLLTYMHQPARPVDAVLLDIRVVGNISGLEAAAILRKNGYNGRMIISSAYQAPDCEILDPLNAEFIPKPWRMNTLLPRLVGDRTQPFVSSTAEGRSLSAYRTVTNSVPMDSITFSSPLKKTCDHLSRLLIESMKVQGVVILLSDSQTDKVEHLSVYPGTGSDETVIAMAADIMKAGKQWAVTHTSAGASQSDNLISFAGLPFNVRAFNLRGALGVLTTGQRQWSEYDHSLLYSGLDVITYAVKQTRSTMELTERNQELNAYTDTIAHDLKTPLAAITNYVDLIHMLHGSSLTSEVSQYLGNIGHSASIMSDMITHLLWIARLEKPIQQVGPVNMSQVVAAVMGRLEYAIDERGVRLEVMPELPPVLGIDIWIEEVVANLVSNAVKYIGRENPTPQVWLRGVPMDGLVRYEVQDNGIGIKPEDQAKLFHDFTRLHQEDVEGVGLGLSIVARMIRRLGGQVGVVSESGQGSTFWFTLSSPGS